MDYQARSQAGLFEPAGEHYGEVWYEMNGRKVMSRSTTEPIVLSVIYQLANLSPPKATNESGYSGHPLQTRPAGAPYFYYIIWPGLIAMAWLYSKKETN